MSSKQNFTMVYYYIPEDFDDPETPNVFGVSCSQEDIRISHIKNNFPLEGEYHFRFKVKINNQLVWLDLENEEAKLPLLNGRLFVKATRISWNSNSVNINKEMVENKKTSKQESNGLGSFSKANVQQTAPKQQKENWNPGPLLENSLSQKPINKESDLLDFDNLDLRSEPKGKSAQKKMNDDLIDF